MKCRLLALLALGVLSVQAHSAEDEKIIAAIGMSDFKKATSLYRKFVSSLPSSHDQKDLHELLSLTAADVTQDRKESISLTVDRRDIMAGRRSEKLSDQALIGAGIIGIFTGLMSVKAACEEYYYPEGYPVDDRKARFALKGSYGLFGVCFGSFLAYSGYQCVTQKRAIESAERIKDYFDKQALSH